MTTKPFIVLKLNTIYQAPKSEYIKGFYAFFNLLLVLPDKNEIKQHEFKISLDSYHYLLEIDNMINGTKSDLKDEIILKIQNDIFENVNEFPIAFKREGNDYSWFLLSKMIEVSENV